MKSLLVGNGINIQFGGKAYSSEFIMKRIKYQATLDSYTEIFGNALTGKEIIAILDGFVDIGNEIRNGDYDQFVDSEDLSWALEDFKNRYGTELCLSHEIMLEDWFFIIHMFFLKNGDLKENARSAIQGFEQLILDAIYNGGKIQELYSKMSKESKRYFKSFDNMFTLNYDNNIEMLTQKEVYHLHGDFNVLANSENLSNVQGYIREQADERVVVSGKEHCYCNALLNYSGELKYRTAKIRHDLLIDSNEYRKKYDYDPDFRSQLSALESEKPVEYEMIMTKIFHPELTMGTEYHFHTLQSVQDELHIIGISPNNDGHIFNLILNNKSLNKVVFYYFLEAEKKDVEKQYSTDLFECRSIQDLWKSLKAIAPQYNCSYKIPDEIDQFMDIFNELSGDVATKEQVLKEISQKPQFEIERLCALVKADMLLRNPEYKITNEADFLKANASISYVALQEGVLPSSLYMMCTMNFKAIKN